MISAKTMAAVSVIFTAATATACSSEADRIPEPDRPAPEPAVSQSSPDSTRTNSARQKANCVALPISDVRLTGRVQREVKLGPPGYGDTPARDKRDTILVLRLDEPISACPDTALKPRSSKVSVVADVQLTGHVDPNRMPVEGRVTVYGTVQRAELAWHYMPVIMRVDSIPGALVPSAQTLMSVPLGEGMAYAVLGPLPVQHLR